jgi:hypothetical protein
MRNSESGTRNRRPPGFDAALVAAGLARLVADARALAGAEPAVLGTRIGRMLPLLARRCAGLGAALPPAELPALAAIPSSPRDPAALRCSLSAFLEDIETVALLAAHAEDAATIRLLDDLRAAVARLVRAVDRSARGGG